MKVVVFGANGQLGQEILLHARARGITATGIDLPEVDITRSAPVAACVDVQQPDLVINAAAYTQVDRAESEPDLAHAVNCAGAGHIAAACADHDIPLIHLSTDFVFDGTKGQPYETDDPVAPLSVYGRSKADGEAAVRRRTGRHVIIRTSWLYGVYGQNFVKTMLRLAATESRIRVVDDQIGSPTCADHLADGLLTMAGRILASGGGPWGTYHFCGAGHTSWYGFAQTIFDITEAEFGLPAVKTVPVSTMEYPTPAQRPRYSVLSCRKTWNDFGLTPEPWQEGLSRTLKRLEGKPQ